MLGTLVGLLLAGVLNATTVRTYASSTELFVAASDTTDTPSAYQGALFTQERIASYAELLTSDRLAQSVVDQLQLPLTAGQVSGKIVATPIPKTDILDVTVTDTSPRRAQAIAASVADQFAVRVTELETPDGAQTSTVRVDTLEAADFRPDPVSPTTTRNYLLGAVLGLLAGLALALLRERTRKSVQDKGDVAKVTGAPLLAAIDEDRQLSRTPLPQALAQQSSLARAIRVVRLDLQDPDRSNAPRVVAVTSPTAGDGKSTVAVALAVSLARAGSRVALVDGNLWRPRLGRYLGMEEAPVGLSDVLGGTAELGTAMRSTTVDRLTLLSPGAMPDAPEELLGSSAMGALLASLRGSHDFVVVDAPPLIPVIDGVALAAHADGCLMVARYATTTRDELADAVSALAAGKAQLLGVVLNRVPVASRTRASRGRYSADDGRATVGARAGLGQRTPVTNPREQRVLPAPTHRVEPEAT